MLVSTQAFIQTHFHKADDIRTKHAFVWGDLNAPNEPNAF